MANVRDVFARTFTASNFRKMRLSYTLTAFVLFIVFFAGAATAAIDALPGDLLYPLKINLNERFESLIAVDPEVKAKIAVKHAVNRITEAEQLAVKGRINAKAINYFNVGFTMQSSNVLDNVTRLQTEGRTDAAIRISSYFESSLAERQKNIENLANGADGKGKEILSVARQNILATITSANKQRSEIEKRRVNLKTSTAVSANTEVNTLIGTTTNIPVQNRTVNSVTAATSTPPNSINATTSVKLNLNSTPQTGHGTGTVPSTSRPEISISVPSAR